MAVIVAHRVPDGCPENDKQHCGRHEEVSGAHKEVAMEGGHTQVLGCTDAHDGLERDGHRKDFSELVRELDCVFCRGGVEYRVKVHLAGRVV